MLTQSFFKVSLGADKLELLRLKCPHLRNIGPLPFDFYTFLCGFHYFGLKYLVNFASRKSKLKKET